MRRREGHLQLAQLQHPVRECAVELHAHRQRRRRAAARQARHDRLDLRLQIERRAIVAGGTADGEGGLRRLREFKPVVAQVDFFEVVHLRVEFQLQRRLREEVRAEPGGEVGDLRIDAELELLAALFGKQFELHRQPPGGNRVAENWLPRREIKIRHRQFEGRIAGRGGVLAPGHGHRFREAAMQERLLVLRAVECEGLHLGGLGGGVDRHVARHLQIQRRRGLAFLCHAEFAGVETRARRDERTALRQRHLGGGVERGRAEINAERRADEIQHLPVNRGDFQFQVAFLLREIHRAAHLHFAEHLLAAQETFGKFLDLRGCDVAREHGADSGQLVEGSLGAQNFLFNLGLERLRRQVRAQRELDVARALRFEHVVGGTAHFERRRHGQFAGLPVLELVERDVHAGQFGHFTPAVLKDFDAPDGRVFQREIFQINLRRLGRSRLGRRLARGLGLFFQQRVKVAAAVGVLDDLHHGRINGHFIHLQRPAENGEQAVAQNHRLRLQQRLGAGGLDRELAQRHLGERTDGCLGHGDFAAQRLASARQNHALQERRTRDHEIGHDEQHEQQPEDEQQFAAPRRAPTG